MGGWLPARARTEADSLPDNEVAHPEVHCERAVQFWSLDKRAQLRAKTGILHRIPQRNVGVTRRSGRGSWIHPGVLAALGEALSQEGVWR